MWRTEGCISGLQFPLCSFHVSNSIYYLLIFTWFPSSPLKWNIFFKPNFSWVQLLSGVRLFATPWTAACQASLSITISRSSLRLTSIESVMPIQKSHPLSSPSPPALNLSQHQDLFQWVSSSHQVAKVLELQLQHQSFQWIFRTDFL